MLHKPLTEQIAEFVLGLTYEDIPEEVIRYTKLVIIDSFGCIFPSMAEEHASSVLRMIRKMPNQPEASLWGSSERALLDHALLYNGCLIHGLDYDDTHGGAIIHPSSSVLTTAVTLGEALGVGGKDVITAMIAAYEVLIRLGEACKGKMHLNNFHPTGVFAPFAAICIAGRYYGADQETLMNAMGIAGSMAAALMQFSVDGSWSKKLHPGWGAHAGMYAFRLAQEGYKGPLEVFEGAKGLYQAHIRTTDYLEETFSDFHQRWYTLEIAFKFYPVCHMMHSHLDILLRLMEENAIRPDEIESIHALLSPRAAEIIGLPPELKQHPQNDYLMRFSIQYNLAVAVLHGGIAMSDIDMRWLKEPEVLEMIDRVTVVASPEAEVAGHFPGDLTIVLKDGRRFRRFQQYETGSRENPAKKEHVLRKYYANVEGFLPRKQADALIRRIDDFENAENMNCIIKMLER